MRPRRQISSLLNSEGNTVPHDYSHGLLHEWIETRASRTPEQPAVGFEGQWLSYRELDEKANHVAWWLERRGVGPDVVVGLCLDLSLETVVGLLGVLKAGGAYVPMDSALPRARLDYVVKDAGIAVMLTDRRMASSFTTQHVLCLDEQLPPLTTPQSRPHSGVAPDNLAYVIYTSGSTGTPKGVMMSHRGIQRLASDLRSTVIGDNPFPSVVTLNAPVYFDGSIKQICWMAGGASMVLVPDGARQDPELLLEVLRAERVDLMDCTPTLLEMFSLLVGLDELPSGLRLLVGGEAIGSKLWSELRNGHLEAYNLYGPTESNAITVMGINRSENPSIGRPLPGYAVHIVDDDGTLVPAGSAGELVVSGEGIARGYRNRPALTAERFATDAFDSRGRRSYRTGDICRQLCDGTIEFIGRKDDQVKLRGYRMELGDIEAALQTQDGVHACVVVLRESPSGDKRLIGYFVATPEISETDLKNQLRTVLPEYMVPSQLMPIDRLPLTRNGKVDRSALRSTG